MSDSTSDSTPPVVRVLRSPQHTGKPIRRLFEEPRRPRIIKRQVLERLEHCEEALHRAEATARELVERARREADAIREEAQQQGRSEGYAEMLMYIAEARQRKAAMLAAAEPEMLELAFRIARRLLGVSLEIDPGLVEQIVRQSLAHAQGRDQIVLLVHPEDLPHLEPARAEFAELLGGTQVVFTAHPEIPRGGCVLETETGRIDARLEVQLERLYLALQARA